MKQIIKSKKIKASDVEGATKGNLSSKIMMQKYKAVLKCYINSAL